MSSRNRGTRMAPACDCFTLCAYFGFARKVSWSAAACSMPETPVISIEPSPLHSQPSTPAKSPSFILIEYGAGGEKSARSDRGTVLDAGLHPLLMSDFIL